MNDLNISKSSSLFYAFRYQIAIGLITFISIINLTIDIMELDASQYASIALEMSHNGSYLQVFRRGEDFPLQQYLLLQFSTKIV
ncbi:MAG: hypothetical protein ABIQ02_09555 [Saprospiraceae bacterium]